MGASSRTALSGTPPPATNGPSEQDAGQQDTMKKEAQGGS